MKNYLKGLWERTIKVTWFVIRLLLVPIILVILIIVGLFYLVSLPFVWFIFGEETTKKFVSYHNKLTEDIEFVLEYGDKHE